MLPVLLACLLGPPDADANTDTPERLELPTPANESTPSEPATTESASSTTETGQAPEQSEPQAQAEPEPTWETQLVVDVNYGFNSNLPDNHLFRDMYNPRTGEFNIAAVGAFVRHALREDEPWQFELGLQVGSAVDALTSGDPIPGGPNGKFAGSDVFKHIAVANVGFLLRKSKTAFAGGVFESPLGIGSFWTYRNWNYTPSWESNSVPFYLTGARIVQPLPAGFELTGWVVNGFQSYADGNAVPSGIVALNWTRPVPEQPRPRDSALSLTSQVFFGPEGEHALGPKDWLVFWDNVVFYDFDKNFSLAGVWDFGVDRPGRHPGASPYSSGALFARGLLYEGKHASLNMAVRPEATWDPKGRFTGAAQWLIAGTGTLSLTLFEHLLVRAEYRYDHSTAPHGFFYRHEFTSPDSLHLAQDQHTVFLSLGANWSFWFGGKKKT